MKRYSKINNLNTDSLPTIPKGYIEGEASSEKELTETNKIFSKKNIIIGLTVIALIGVGIWYFYYNSGNGTVDPNLPPQNPPHNPPQDIVPQTIGIIDRQTGSRVDPNTLTDAERLSLLDRADLLRNAGRLNTTDYEHLVDRILPPAPSYEGPAQSINNNEPIAPISQNNEGVEPVTETSAAISHNQPITETIPSITESRPSSSRFQRELNRYFPINGDNATASGSGSNNNETSTSLNPVNENSNNEGSVMASHPTQETPAENPTINVIPASPVDYDPIETFNQPVNRPLSPSGSDDSSETIRPFLYGDPGERPRVALPRDPFDHSNRRGN